jgi:hypothetical protein
LQILIAVTAVRAAHAQPSSHDNWCAWLARDNACDPTTQACTCLADQSHELCFRDPQICDAFRNKCVTIQVSACAPKGTGPAAEDPQERARREQEQAERAKQAREAAERNHEHVDEERAEQAARDNQSGSYLQGALVNGIHSWLELKTVPQAMLSATVQAQRLWVEWADLAKLRAYLRHALGADPATRLALPPAVPDASIAHATASGPGSLTPMLDPAPTPLPAGQQVKDCASCRGFSPCQLACLGKHDAPWTKTDPTEVQP